MYFRANKNVGSELSLYDPIETEKDSGTVTLMDTLAAPDEIDAEVELLIDCEKLHAALQRLDLRSRRVVALRYGLFGTPPATQKEVAKVLGISRSYVSRIEKAALEQLHDAL